MNDDFQSIRKFDELEKLMETTGEPRVEDPEMAELLGVIDLLGRDAEAMPAMPRPVEFRKHVMAGVQTRRKQHGWMGGLMVLAAAVVLGFLLVPGPKSQTEPGGIVIDQDMLERAEKQVARDAMLDYLESTEQLLVAMRDFEVSCDKGDMNVGPEKELAHALLLKQKNFAAQYDRPEFFQARNLFQQLEPILVDVNSLDLCTDPFEVDFIIEHVNENRILSQLRHVAQDLRIS